MRLPHLAVSVLLLGMLGGGAAWSQSAVAPAQPGSLPPPRPLQAPAQPTPAPANPPAAAPSAPRPQGQAPQAPPRPPQGQAQPARPATPPPTTVTPPRPPAQPPQAARPSGQAPAAANPARPAAGTPTVNRPAQPNRRPAAAAAGAAAGAAAAGAAAAANRTPEPAAPPQPAPPPVPAIGSVTGLALPRFAALRSDEVNMRVGPNTTFPIEWTFQRRDLPVQIIGEFQLWRRIRDVDGAEGWVHSSTLMGRRTVLVRPQGNAEQVPLRRRPEEGGSPVAQLRPGVIARIRECEAGSGWCQVQVAGHRGYLRRVDVWGVGPDEEVK